MKPSPLQFPLCFTATGVAACVAAFLSTGCSSASSSPATPVYTTSQTGQVISQDAGQVVSVEEVVIKASGKAAGATGTGATIGGSVGQAVLTRNPLAILGAVGHTVGSNAGATLDNQTGDRITVQLDNGKTVVIVQARDAKEAPLMPGERVTIESGSSTSIYGGGNTRVVREPVRQDPNYVIGAEQIKTGW